MRNEYRDRATKERTHDQRAYQRGLPDQDNTLRIRDQEHRVEEVLLYLEHRARPEDGLTFSLFADTGELQQAGLSINCMSVPGAARIDHLRFELDADRTDALNELGESVIGEPGAVLELTSLRLAFGPVHDGAVSITLDAVCHTRHEASIPVRGDFVARIVQDEPPADQTAQLALPL
jgi:hypothetical protein